MSAEIEPLTPRTTTTTLSVQRGAGSSSQEVEVFIEGSPDPPEDTNNVVYWIVMLHGIGTLMPWNMFITIATMYYSNFKLLARETHFNSTIFGDEIPKTVYLETYYSREFMQWVSVCSQMPNLLLNMLNIFAPIKGDLIRRITASLTLVAFVVLLTDIFVYVDTFTWIPTFFYLTLISVAVLNGANGVYQNSIYGLCSDFPFKYTNAVIIGSNLCGSFVAVLNIIAVASTDDPQLQACIFFTVSLLTLVACFLSFFVLRKQEFYRYNSTRGRELRESEASSSKGSFDTTEYLQTIKEGWPQFVNVFLIFFVTLSLFPGVMVAVKAPQTSSGDYDFWLPQPQYVNITCFLLFNMFAWIGSMLADSKRIFTSDNLMYGTLARLLFIPFLMMCNYYPGGYRGLPVWFSNIYIYLFVCVLMALSSGYMSSLAMMYAPRVVDPSRARIAGMMAAFFLILGVVCGLCFTMVIAAIVRM